MALGVNEYHPSNARKASKPSICCSPWGSARGSRCCSAGWPTTSIASTPRTSPSSPYATVEQKLEGDLEVAREQRRQDDRRAARPRAGSRITRPPSRAIAGRLLEEQRHRARGGRRRPRRGAVQRRESAGHRRGRQRRPDRPRHTEPLMLTKAIPAVTTAQGPRGGGTLEVWVSRARMQDDARGFACAARASAGQPAQAHARHARAHHAAAGGARPDRRLVHRAPARAPDLRAGHARRTASARATTPGPCASCAATSSASCSIALERMRQKLRETTITKNYLDTVLNSLSDCGARHLAGRPHQELQSRPRSVCSAIRRTKLIGKPLVELHRRGAPRRLRRCRRVGGRSARDRAAHRERADHPGVDGRLARSPRRTRSSRATSTSRATSPSASAPSAASAIWRATTR